MNAAPIIIHLKQAEYGELLTALSEDEHFHDVLRRVVTAHSDKHQGIVVVPVDVADAQRMVSDLSIEEFESLSHQIETMRHALEEIARNRRIEKNRFSLPSVRSFFG